MKLTQLTHIDSGSLAKMLEIKNISRAALSLSDNRGGFLVAKHFPGVAWLKSFKKDSGEANLKVREAFVARLRDKSASVLTSKGKEFSQEARDRLANSINVNSRRPLTLRKIYWTNVANTVKNTNWELKPQVIKLAIATKLFGRIGAKCYQKVLRNRAESGKTTWWEKLVRFAKTGSETEISNNLKLRADEIDDHRYPIDDDESFDEEVTINHNVEGNRGTEN